MATWTTERAEAERERAFLDAVAAGRAPKRPPRVQDLERYAPSWASLVPPDPRLRAAVAKLLGEKYRLPRGRVPRIAAALGLDGDDLRDLTVDRLSVRERLAWQRAAFAERVETMPAFWTAFGLTFTEMVGVGMLGLPIALAGLGIGPALALLVAFGLVNVITLAALTEAIARDGNMRYGAAYFGRLVGDFLGRPGRTVVGVALLVFSVLVLTVVAIGFGETLHAATGIPVVAWIFALLAVDLLFLTRRSLDATIASALVIGGVNIALVVAISLVALPHARGEHLAGGATAAGTSLLAILFGVLMSAYFGHTSAATLAKVVLAREPTGRDLLRGCVLATFAAMGVYALFTTATLAAVAPATLAAETGTPLTPLAAVAGPAVHLLGSVYVVLALGIGSIHFTIALANQAREFVAAPSGNPARQALARLAADPRATFAVAAVPTIAIYALVIAQVLAASASFSGALSVAGTIVVPMVGGVFPMLLLAAARRRGEYVPAVAPAWLGHPFVVVGIAALFLTGPVAHGLVIWTDPLERAAALAAVVLTLAVAVLALRNGAFVAQTVVEVRREQSAGDAARFTVTGGGRPLVARVEVTDGHGTRHVESAAGELGRFDGLRTADFELPPHRARDLKVWVHAVDGDGATTSLPATVRLAVNGSAPTDHKMTGELRLAGPHAPSRIEVRLAGPKGATP